MRPSDSEKEFERLVTEHRATIYTVCYMFSKDADEVADLFQEVLVNLWRGMGGFEGRSDVRTWIYRVSLNTCVSHDRISRLEPFDRAIILLWLESLPYDEIGQIVGISPKNVSVRLTRIREKLKNMQTK